MMMMMASQTIATSHDHHDGPSLVKYVRRKSPCLASNHPPIERTKTSISIRPSPRQPALCPPPAADANKMLSAAGPIIAIVHINDESLRPVF